MKFAPSFPECTPLGAEKVQNPRFRFDIRIKPSYNQEEIGEFAGKMS